MTSDGYHPRPFRQAAWKRPSVRLGSAAVISFIIIFLLLRPSTSSSGLKGPVSEGGGVQPSYLVGGVHSGPLNGRRLMTNGLDDAGALPVVAQQQSQQALEPRALVGGRPAMRPLVEGRDYFADYDVSAVQIKNEPFPVGKKVFFNYIDPEAHPEFAMQYVSNEPRILFIQDFLSEAECDMLVDVAATRLHRSLVVPQLHSDHKPVSDVRTSDQTFLDVNTPQVQPIVARILNLTGFKVGAAESLQILRYQLNQKYDAHNDYFDPKLYGSQFTNRAVTVFLYLSDVEEGGETQFPRADGKGPTFDLKSCSRGLRVRPRKGQVALFYDMKPWGQLDPFSLHGGCPVKKGVKWGGTLWLRVPTGGEP